jgi:beta-fructofuranosidase
MMSKDLVHWEHLPVALAPDQKYDCGGVFSGSATIVPGLVDGKDTPVLTYSVACGKAIVNSYPLNASDPKLINWTKPSFNPVIEVPATVKGGFRDPTTAWQGTDKTWRMLVGCGNGEGTCMFKSKNFVNWTYTGQFHGPSQTNPKDTSMWECPDFFEVNDATGKPSGSYILKASAGGDWWTVGKWTQVSDDAKPDSFAIASNNDIHGDNQKYDMGVFYASKVFVDPVKKRQVLFGWVNYNCPGTDWTGIQSFPRSVTLDPANATKIVSNPIEEIKALYTKTDSKTDIVVTSGSKTVIGSGLQLDVELTFKLDSTAPQTFGLGALAASDGTGGKRTTIVTPKPSPDKDTFATIDGHRFLVAKGETSITLRVLVDHSVVEVYAQGGRIVATYPYCPPSTANDAVVVFNNGPAPLTVSTVDVHTLATANVIPSTSSN